MRNLFVCLLFGLLAACAANKPATRAATTAPDANAALLADLRNGGYIVYLRHAETLASPEAAVHEFTDCSWQRNLTPRGREQAAGIGAKLREVGFTATVVESSPFCRTRETAEIAFGRPPKVVFDLYYHVTQAPAEAAAVNAKLKSRLGQRPPDGGNLALVGHAPPLRDAAGVELQEGQGVIVKPGVGGAFKIVAQIDASGILPAP